MVKITDMVAHLAKIESYFAHDSKGAKIRLPPDPNEPGVEHFKMIKSFSYVSVSDPLTGELFAKLEDAPETAAQRKAKIKTFKGILKTELIDNLKDNKDW